MARRSLVQQAVPLVSSLPTSPVDGQVIDYLANAVDGVVWRLRYRAASTSPYKWEFIGGSALAAKVDTNQPTTSASYADLATLGPDITIPLVGDYDVQIGARIQNSAFSSASEGYMNYSIGGAAPDGADVCSNIVTAQYGGSTPTSLRRKTGLAAGTLIRCKYASQSGTTTFMSRILRVTPVRVG
jgi:hypothetical protein